MMAKRQPVEIDEELVRQMIGGQVPTTISGVEESQSDELSQQKNNSDQHRRRSSLPDFEKTFLAPIECKTRASLYVSADTKRTIMEVIRKIGGDRTTITAYVEHILRHHLDLYRDEINRLHKARNSENIL